MQGLYRRVLKGRFKPVPKQYSQELSAIVKCMLALKPEDRPSCDEII